MVCVQRAVWGVPGVLPRGDPPLQVLVVSHRQSGLCIRSHLLRLPLPGHLQAYIRNGVGFLPGDFPWRWSFCGCVKSLVSLLAPGS